MFVRNNKFAGLVLFGAFAFGMIQGNIASAISIGGNLSADRNNIENKSSNNCVEKKNLEPPTEFEKKGFKENRDIPDKDILKNNKDEVPKTGFSKGLASTSLVPLKGRSLVATEFEQRGKGYKFREGNSSSYKNVIKNGKKETFLTGPGNVGFDKGLIYTGGSAAFLSLACRLVKGYIDSKDENKSSQGEEVIYDNEDGKKGNKNKQEEQKNLWKVSFKYIGKTLFYIIIVALVVLLVFFVCYFYLKNSLRKKLLSLKNKCELDILELEGPLKNNIQIGSNSGNVGAGLNISTNLNGNIIQTGKTGDNLFTTNIEKIEKNPENNANFAEGLGLNIPDDSQLSYEAKVDALLNNLGILGLFKFNSGINQAGMKRLIILLDNLVDYNAKEVVYRKMKKVEGKTDCFKSMLSAVKIENKWKAYLDRKKDNIVAHFAILLNKITDEGALNFAKLLSKLYTTAKEYLSPYCHAEKLGLLLSGLNNDGLTNFSTLLGELDVNGIKMFVKLIECSFFPPRELVYLLNKLSLKGLDNFVKALNAKGENSFSEFFSVVECQGQYRSEPFQKFVELLNFLSGFGVSSFIEMLSVKQLDGAYFAEFLKELNDKSIINLANVLDKLVEKRKGVESFAILLNSLYRYRMDTLTEVFTKLGADSFVTLLETFKEGGAARFAEVLSEIQIYRYYDYDRIIMEMAIFNCIKKEEDKNFQQLLIGNNVNIDEVRNLEEIREKVNNKKNFEIIKKFAEKKVKEEFEEFKKLKIFEYIKNKKDKSIEMILSKYNFNIVEIENLGELENRINNGKDFEEIKKIAKNKIGEPLTYKKFVKGKVLYEYRDRPDIKNTSINDIEEHLREEASNAQKAWKDGFGSSLSSLNNNGVANLARVVNKLGGKKSAYKLSKLSKLMGNISFNFSEVMNSFTENGTKVFAKMLSKIDDIIYIEVLETNDLITKINGLGERISEEEIDNLVEEFIKELKDNYSAVENSVISIVNINANSNQSLDYDINNNEINTDSIFFQHTN